MYAIICMLFLRKELFSLTNSIKCSVFLFPTVAGLIMSCRP